MKAARPRWSGYRCPHCYRHTDGPGYCDGCLVAFDSRDACESNAQFRAGGRWHREGQTPRQNAQEARHGTERVGNDSNPVLSSGPAPTPHVAFMGWLAGTGIREAERLETEAGSLVGKPREKALDEAAALRRRCKDQIVPGTRAHAAWMAGFEKGRAGEPA